MNRCRAGRMLRFIHSIRTQFVTAVIFLIVLTLGSILLVNNFFLEKYYLNIKEESLLQVYDTINGAQRTDQLRDEDTDVELQRMCSRFNISMLILNENQVTFKATMNDSEFLKRQLVDRFFSIQKTERGDLQTIEVPEPKPEKGPVPVPMPRKEQILAQTDNYEIVSAEDPAIHTEFIEMWGFLDNGYMFMLRTPREGIQDSVSIANHFAAFVGIVAIIISGGLTILLCSRITRPILELSHISEQMKELNFETKYQGRHKNELDILGQNINRLSEKLETTISELKTANNELQKDVEKKTKIDEMRKEFLSNVSHELKTPLALIQGYAEGLHDGISDDVESREFYCEVIMDEAGKMNDMVQKLLTLNQLEFGNDMVSMSRFDLMELIGSFLSSAELLAKQNDITVNLDAPEHCFVWADAFKTEEVVRNYFSNAMNHCSGERIIQLKVAMQGDRVRVSVFNTGERIPDDSVAHLWEKFYKVDKARTRAYGGSGVGLSIVKAIMESMNQKYGVNNYDNGVEFWFELSVN